MHQVNITELADPREEKQHETMQRDAEEGGRGC